MISLKRLRLTRVSVRFEPRDAWVGLYWDRKQTSTHLVSFLILYICLVPFFPVIVSVVTRDDRALYTAACGAGE